MKKVLSLVLVLAMVLGSFSLVSAAPLSDIAGTEYEAAVERLTQLGALDGYPDGTFKPSAEITRAEFAAALIKTKGLKAAAVAATGLPSGFTDVPATNWASGYVGLAAKLGIVNGVGNNKFDPNAPVTYEQAVTMIMRALGYEPAAATRGGYPYGYLILASEQGLLESVKGTQGTPALRGTVAQLLDNALETPMMVQSGYGPNATWVVSGTQNVPLKILLDELGFDNYEGRVVSVDADRNRITLENENGKSKTVKVNKGFDFNFVEGLIIKVWFANDTVAVYSAIDVAKYDAVDEYDAKEIKLVGENKRYKLAKDAYLELDGDDEVKAEDFTADYAKVVLNEDNQVVWAKGYTLTGFIVVEEVKNDIVYSFDNDELDVEDFTLLKDGKTISVEDLEELDILFFNKGEEVAVVYNDVKDGEVERVYSDSFKLAGKVYGINEGVSKYLDNEDMGALNADVLDAMVEADKEVEVFFNTRGKVVLVAGDRGVAKTNKFFGKLTADSVNFKGRKGDMLALDVRNEEAKVVSFDLSEKFITDGKVEGLTEDTLVKAVAELKENTPVRITTNADGEATLVEKLAVETLSKEFKKTATYANAVGNVDYRLSESTLVFYGKKVVKLGEATDFSVVKAGTFYEEKGRVLAVFATATDANDDTTAHTGLVKRVRTLTSGASELTLEVYGETKVFLTSKDNAAYTNNVNVNTIVKVTVGNKDEIITKAVETLPGTTNVVVKSVNTANRTITAKVSGDVYELNSKAVVYSLEGSTISTKNLRDLKEDDVLTVYKDGNSARFVNYVIRHVGAAPGAGTNVEGLVTLINSGKTAFAVANSDPYTVDDSTVLRNKAGNVVAIGKDDIFNSAKGNLIEGDKVEVKAKDGVAIEIKRLQTAAELELEAAKAAVVKAEGSKLQADVTAAKTLVNALPADVAPATTKADLQARVALVEAVVAVIKAEGSKLQADLDSARVLVNGLPADVAPATTKADLGSRLDALQLVINLEAAKAAVVKAEGSKLQADVTAAKTLVNALPADVAPATTKADLQARVAVVEAEVAVIKAEVTQLQTDKDAAQLLVTALPNGAVKDALQARLNAVTPA